VRGSTAAELRLSGAARERCRRSEPPGPGQPEHERGTPGWCSSCGPAVRRAALLGRLALLAALAARAARLPRYAPVGDTRPPVSTTTQRGVARARWLERPHRGGHGGPLLEAAFPRHAPTRTAPHPSTPAGRLPLHDASRCGRSSPPPGGPPRPAGAAWIGASARATGGSGPARSGSPTSPAPAPRRRGAGLVDEGFDGVPSTWSRWTTATTSSWPCCAPCGRGGPGPGPLHRGIRRRGGTTPRAPTSPGADYYAAWPRPWTNRDHGYDTALPTPRPTALRALAPARWRGPSTPPARGAVLMGIPTYEPYGFMHAPGRDAGERAGGVVAGLRASAPGDLRGRRLYASGRPTPPSGAPTSVTGATAGVGQRRAGARRGAASPALHLSGRV